MPDRPILFSAPMVRALLERRKTQTRRVLKPQPHFDGVFWNWGAAAWSDGVSTFRPAPCHSMANRLPYAPGDRLWVREAWRTALEYDDQPPSKVPPGTGAEYDLEVRQHGSREAGRYRHARFMPRWASRLTLLVTDVRVQRLQDISEADAIAEGIEQHGRFFGPPEADWDDAELSAAAAYARLWNSLHGPDAWAQNPWVVAVSFDVRRGNIDEERADG